VEQESYRDRCAVILLRDHSIFGDVVYSIHVYIIYIYNTSFHFQIVHHYFHLCGDAYMRRILNTLQVYIYVNYDNINKTIEQHMYICIFIYKYQYKQTA